MDRNGNVPALVLTKPVPIVPRHPVGICIYMDERIYRYIDIYRYIPASRRRSRPPWLQAGARAARSQPRTAQAGSAGACAPWPACARCPPWVHRNRRNGRGHGALCAIQHLGVVG